MLLPPALPADDNELLTLEIIHEFVEVGARGALRSTDICVDRFPVVRQMEST